LTDTAVLKVLADILGAVDRGAQAMLMLLDLSAAFDTVGHKTHLHPPKEEYNVAGTVCRWFISYLCKRS